MEKTLRTVHFPIELLVLPESPEELVLDAVDVYLHIIDEEDVGTETVSVAMPVTLPAEVDNAIKMVAAKMETTVENAVHACLVKKLLSTNIVRGR